MATKTDSLRNEFFLLAISFLPFWIGIYFVLPTLYNNGFSKIFTFSVGIFLPLAILLSLAIYYALKERDTPDWKGIKDRLHLKPMKKSDWGWTGLLLLITLLGYFTLAGTTDWVLSIFPFLKAPEVFDQAHANDTFFGIPLKGNWWVLGIHVAVLVLNVAGEELWFRGVIFPKQRLKYGKWAWLAHGIFYHLWHMIYPWSFFRLLPESLAYGWVAQKTGNTWTCIISHFIFNGLGLIQTISLIMQ